MKNLFLFLFLCASALGQIPTPIQNAQIYGASTVNGTIDFTNATVSGLPNGTANALAPNVSGSSNLTGNTLAINGTLTLNGKVIDTFLPNAGDAPGYLYLDAGGNLTMLQEAPNSLAITLANGSPAYLGGIVTSKLFGWNGSSDLAEISLANLSISGNTLDLSTTSATPGSYGNSTQSVSVTVDSMGRITGVSNNTISIAGDFNGTIGNATIANGAQILGSGNFQDDQTFNANITVGNRLTLSGFGFANTSLLVATSTGRVLGLSGSPNQFIIINSTGSPSAISGGTSEIAGWNGTGVSATLSLGSNLAISGNAINVAGNLLTYGGIAPNTSTLTANLGLYSTLAGSNSFASPNIFTAGITANSLILTANELLATMNVTNGGSIDALAANLSAAGFIPAADLQAGTLPSTVQSNITATGTVATGTYSANISGASLTGNLALGGETLTGNATLSGTTITFSGGIKSGSLTINGTPVAFADPYSTGGVSPPNFIYIDSTFSVLRIGAQGSSGVSSIAIELSNGTTGYQDAMDISNVSVSPSSSFDNMLNLGISGSGWKTIYDDGNLTVGGKAVSVLTDNGTLTVASTSTFTGLITASAGVSIPANNTFTVAAGTTSGVATLVAGQVFVATAGFTTNSTVTLTNLTNGGTVVGQAWLSNQTVGTGFNITSTSLDASTYKWTIIH